MIRINMKLTAVVRKNLPEIKKNKFVTFTIFWKPICKRNQFRISRACTHTRTKNAFLTDTLICTLLKSFVTHENLSKLVMIATVWGNSKMTSTGKGEGEEVVKNGDKKWQKRDGVIQYSDVNHSVFYPDHSVYYFIFITYNSCCLLYHFFRF